MKKCKVIIITAWILIQCVSFGLYLLYFLGEFNEHIEQIIFSVVSFWHLGSNLLILVSWAFEFCGNLPNRIICFGVLLFLFWVGLPLAVVTPFAKTNTFLIGPYETIFMMGITCSGVSIIGLLVLPCVLKIKFCEETCYDEKYWYQDSDLESLDEIEIEPDIKS